VFWFGISIVPSITKSLLNLAHFATIEWKNQGCSGAGQPECGGTLFRQIFLSQNGAPVNIVYHSRNADTEAFQQISL